MRSFHLGTYTNRQGDKETRRQGDRQSAVLLRSRIRKNAGERRSTRILANAATGAVTLSPGLLVFRLLVSLSPCLLVCFLAAPVRADDSPAKPIRVPFELLQTKHIVVNVKVNGKGPYRMIFDTGAPFILINNKLAKEAEVFSKDFKKPFFSLFGNMGQVKLKSLAMGDCEAKNLSAMVMDHPTVSAISEALGPIEGLVGLSFFGRFRMTIDYQAKEMTFVPNHFEPPDMIEAFTNYLMGSNGPAKKMLAPGGLIGLRVNKSAVDTKDGIDIQDVFAGSPAAAAGLKTGDRLLILDGRWTDSVIECYEAASMLKAPAEVRVVILRDGKEQTKTLKVQPGL